MKKWLLSLLFIFACVTVWAQFSINAQVDKTDLTLDDELTLTVEISGANGVVTAPQLPSLPAFNVYSREINQSSINGKSSYLFRYTMLPRLVGNTTIGAISVNYQGQTYRTEPIDVHVYRDSSSQPAPTNNRSGARTQSVSAPVTVEQADPSLPPLERALTNQAYTKGIKEPFFLIAAVNNEKPYVNEPVVLAIRFYYSQAFQDNAPYQKPSVSNIFMEEAGSSEGIQRINGKVFNYMEQRYNLAGATPGQATIGSASVEFFTGNSPFALFDRMFGGSAVGHKQTVRSTPIHLNILPLPSGKPASFYGAVGSGFSLTAKADPTSLEAGESVTVSVTVQGPGNLKTTKDLKFPDLPGFTAYPAAASSGKIPNTKNRSYKIFKTVFVPSSSGIYTFPEIEWSYFDPHLKQYKTLHTQPLTLTVSPSTKVNRGVDFGAVLPTDNGVQALGSNIHYLKTIHGPKPSLLAQLSTWNWLNALVLFALAISIFSASAGKKIWAKKQAFANAKNQLKNATDNQQVADALSGYLAQKFNIHTASTPLRDVVNALHRKEILPSLTDEFVTLWQSLEAARFAPVADNSSVKQRAEDTFRLIKQMEEQHK